MFNLATTTKLQVVLGAAKVTNDSPVFVSYRKRSTQSSPIKNETATMFPPVSTNGVTAVDLVTAASDDVSKSIDSIFLYNKDTVAITATFQLDIGGTPYILFTRVIPVGQSLIYENGAVTVAGDSTSQGRLVNLTAAGTQFDTYTTAKTILPAAALLTFPANFWTVGKTMHIRALMGLSNIVTTPGTLTLQVMMGSVIAFTTGALQLNATAHTLLPFWVEILLTCRAIGSGTTAKFMGMGRVQGIQPTLTAAQTDAANTGGIYSAPATAPALGTGWDSTASQILDFWAGFSISNSGNAIQMQQYTVDVI